MALQLDQIPGIPPELRGVTDEFLRLNEQAMNGVNETVKIVISNSMSVADVANAASIAREQKIAPAVRRLQGHLLLALIEIDWMRTKRSYMPADLRAQLQEMIQANADSFCG